MYQPQNTTAFSEMIGDEERLTQEIHCLREVSKLIGGLVESDNLMVRVEAQRIRDILCDLLFEIDFEIPGRTGTT